MKKLHPLLSVLFLISLGICQQKLDYNNLIERNDNIITLTAEDELKAKQVVDLLTSHIIKRKIDPC